MSLVDPDTRWWRKNRTRGVAGQTRWTRQTIPGEVTKGSQLKVRYSPDDLDRKAAVVVSRS